MRQVFVWLLLTVAGFAQGGIYNDIALDSTGRPSAGAAVRVCSSTATGTPCSPTQTVYSNSALSIVKSSVVADANGNFNFYGTPGPVKIQVTASGSTYTYLAEVPIDATHATLTRLNEVRYADQFSGADMAGKINAAIADLPSTGGTVDARALQGAQTGTATITLGSSTKPVKLLLGATTLTSSANPVIACPLGGASSLEGISPTATVILGTGVGAVGMTWGCSRGSASGFGLHEQVGATNVLVLQASGTTSVQHNNFYNIEIGGQLLAGNVCLSLIADNASALVSFNYFYGMEIIDCSDGWKMSSTGTVGPTDNWIIGGHIRKTSAIGNGIYVASGGNNGSLGLNISGHAIGIKLDSSDATNFQDHGSTLEANTLDVSITNSSADNALIGTTYTTITDSGVRTLQLNTVSVKMKPATLESGQINFNTEDPAVAQQPVFHFQKSIASLDYGYSGEITNTLSGVGANKFGRLGAAGQDIWDILDNTSGSPTFNIGRKNAGTVFSVDPTGNTVVGGTLTIGSGTPIVKYIEGTVTVDLASIAANTCTDTAGITVTGAVDGDVAAGSTLAAIASTAGLQISAYVSAANTAKVRVCNVTVGAIDPASTTYRVGVWVH